MNRRLLLQPRRRLLSTIGRPMAPFYDSDPSLPPPPPSPSPRQKSRPHGELDGQEFRVNRGRSLEAVVHDTNHFFASADSRGYTPLDLSVYEDDVLFRETVFYEFRMNGIGPYTRLLWVTRSLLRMYYAHSQMEVIKVCDRTPHEFQLQWKFTATPRTLIVFPWSGNHGGDVAGGSNTKGASTNEVVYEGYSVYNLSSRGLINAHTIENIIPTPLHFAYSRHLNRLINYGSLLTSSPTKY